MKISRLMARKNQRTTVVTDVKALRCGTTGIQATLLLLRTVRRGLYFYEMCASRLNELQQYVCWDRNRSEGNKSTKWW
jgi:hypothetical protein